MASTLPAGTGILWYGPSPRIAVPSCVTAHQVNELCVENGTIGVTIEANAASGENTLIEQGVVWLPLWAGAAPGSHVYWTGSLADGTTIQLPPQQTTVVGSTLVVGPPDPPPSLPPFPCPPEAGGAVDAGTHAYAVAFATSGGETAYGPVATVTIPSPSAVLVANLPIGPASASARIIYRSKAGTTSPLYVAGTVGDNTTRSWLDTVPDSSLVVQAPLEGVLIGVTLQTPGPWGATLVAPVYLTPYAHGGGG